ncbi:MAG: hypothetical protein WCI92_07065 [Bacteroidota bacterium]
MKNLSLLILILCSVFIINASAQDGLTYANEIHNPETKVSINPLPVFDFVGYSHNYELEKITSETAGEHLFGDEIAKKMFLLSEKYTSQVELIPGNPQTKTVIQKPVIYEAVKRIEKYLKKSVKKGTISIDPAIYTLNKVLDVALCIRNADTKNFEAAIESSDSDDKKIDLFTKRVNLMY